MWTQLHSSINTLGRIEWWSPAWRIPNNLCRSSAPKKTKLNCPPLKCRQHTATVFYRERVGRGREKEKKPEITTLAGEVKAPIHNGQSWWQHASGVMWQSPPSSPPSQISVQSWDVRQVRNILENSWPDFLKTIELVQNKESLRNHHSKRRLETQDLEPWGDIGTEKEHQVKIKGVWTNSEFQYVRSECSWFISCERHHTANEKCWW